MKFVESKTVSELDVARVQKASNASQAAILKLEQHMAVGQGQISRVTSVCSISDI